MYSVNDQLKKYKKQRHKLQRKFICHVCDAINSPELPNLVNTETGLKPQVRLCGKHHAELNVNREIHLKDGFSRIQVEGWNEHVCYVMTTIPQDAHELKF